MANILGCIIFLILIATPPVGWVILGIWIIIGYFSGSSNTSSSGTTSSSSNAQYTSAPPQDPEDLNNILMDISKGEIRDPYSQETFQPGQKIHFCLTHRLAYHEDSWREMGKQCDVCGHGGNAKVYTLPTPIDFSVIQWNDTKKLEEEK